MWVLQIHFPDTSLLIKRYTVSCGLPATTTQSTGREGSSWNFLRRAVGAVHRSILDISIVYYQLIIYNASMVHGVHSKYSDYKSFLWMRRINMSIKNCLSTSPWVVVIKPPVNGEGQSLQNSDARWGMVGRDKWCGQKRNISILTNLTCWENYVLRCFMGCFREPSWQNV